MVPKAVRELIHKMCRDNPLWGAARIHGELLKRGIDVSETSVGKYIVRKRKPPSQTWRTFLENHAKTRVTIDFFTVPTIRFQILYLFLVLAHDRRRIVHFNVPRIPPPSGPASDVGTELRNETLGCRVAMPHHFSLWPFMLATSDEFTI